MNLIFYLIIIEKISKINKNINKNNLNKIIDTKIIYIFFFLITPALSSNYILIEEEIMNDHTIYKISWRIEVDRYGYYYPSGGEWGIPIPPNTVLESIKVIDNFGALDFKIVDNFIYFYNSRDIEYGEVYYFNISFIRKYNPVSYDNEFYFESDYVLKSIADKIVIKLPHNVKNYTIIYEDELNIKTLSKNPYVLELTSNKSIYPKILFWVEPFEEKKTIIEYKHFSVNIPSKYFKVVEIVLSNIDNKIFDDLKKIFNYTRLNVSVTFYPYSKMGKNELCFYHTGNSSIICGIHLLLFEEKHIIQTLIHEFTHVFIHKVFGSGLPPFFEEGLAETIGYLLSESIGYNFTTTYHYKQKLISSCKNSLYKEFWKKWECERFGEFFCMAYDIILKDECFNNYKTSDIRYTLSWHIISNEIVKKIGIEKITNLSNYFQTNGITIKVDSKNKNSIVVLMFFIVSGKDFTKILESYEIEINPEWIKSYRSFKEAEEKIQNLISSSDFDYYEKAKKILNESLSFLLNGLFDKSIEKSVESVTTAEEIRKSANETKQLILKVNQSIVMFKKNAPFSCIYDYPELLLLQALENYKIGNFKDSKSKIDEALKKAFEMNMTLTNFLKKFNLISNRINSDIFIYKPFLKNLRDKLEYSWFLLSECKLYYADEALFQVEKDLEKSILVSVIIYFFVATIVACIIVFFLRRKLSNK